MSDIAQAIILTSSFATIALIAQRRDSLRFWGFFAGLAGQPAWLLATWRDGQWGIFATALWFTAWYAWGTWRYFRLWMLQPTRLPPRASAEDLAELVAKVRPNENSGSLLLDRNERWAIYEAMRLDGHGDKFAAHGD